MPTAVYDEIADWHEDQVGTRPDDPPDLGRVLRDLLGRGRGTCLEIGCTGMHAGLPCGGPRGGPGAGARPLPALLSLFVDAGLVLTRFAEGGTPTPTVFGVRAVKPG